MLVRLRDICPGKGKTMGYFFMLLIGAPALALLLLYGITRRSPAGDAAGAETSQKNGKRKSVQQFFGFDTFTDVGCKTKAGTLAIFEISPNNLTVLPEHVIADQIWHLQILLQQEGDVEILCMDGADTGEENLRFLRRRIAEEENVQIRELLHQDLSAFEGAHFVSTSIRQFYLVLRLQKLTDAQQYRKIDEFARTVREHNLVARLLTPAEVRHMLGIYYIGYMYAEKWKEDDLYAKTERRSDAAGADDSDSNCAGAEVAAAEPEGRETKEEAV